MRIGIFSDIHGNRPALEAVLDDMPPVDLLLCTGDVVGYYPDVNDVCRALRTSGARVIRGNHDAYVTGALEPAPDMAMAYRTEWTKRHLDPGHMEWLASLPVELTFTFDGRRIRMRHACPWDEESYLYPDSPSVARVELPPGDFLLLGHTHIPMNLPAGQGRLVNPGSVGQPRDYDSRPSYVILDTVHGKVESFRCSYDVAAYQGRLRILGWDSKMIQILSRKKNSL